MYFLSTRCKQNWPQMTLCVFTKYNGARVSRELTDYKHHSEWIFTHTNIMQCVFFHFKSQMVKKTKHLPERELHYKNWGVAALIWGVRSIKTVNIVLLLLFSLYSKFKRPNIWLKFMKSKTIWCCLFPPCTADPANLLLNHFIKYLPLKLNHNSPNSL